MKIIHIVRRYGPVGGMERYVWETTHELVKLGYEVQVICEVCLAEPSVGIVVHQLGRMRYHRPRWICYWRFSRRVDAWLKTNPQPGWLIHSHERVGVHDVTTFHGPPFASVRDKPWWKKVSIRIAAQFWLERRELRVTKAIVPNSDIIAKQLAHYYPEYAHKLTTPIVPGVQFSVMRTSHVVAADGGIIGFVGCEWQRKGLPLAVEIAAHLRQTRSNLELWVIGPKAPEIIHLFKAWQGGFRLLGWCNDNTHFEKIDVLLHPAKAEPYGMVISEAMSARVPVVVSDQCGAAEQVSSEAGEVVPLSADLDQWVNAVQKQMNRDDQAPQFIRGWDLVAREYLAEYARLKTQR